MTENAGSVIDEVMNEKDKKENTIAASDFDFTVQDSKKEEPKAPE